MSSAAEKQLQIFGFIQNSFIDWDGMIASVIFLPGCNFKCPFCHNHELVFEWKKLEDKRVDPSHVLSVLSEHKQWIDGLTVTGGEPTLHIDALIPFLEAVRKIGVKIKVDTNGANPSALKKLSDCKLVDYIAMDVKAKLDEESYKKAAGVDGLLDKVKESISFIISSGIDHEFRTTVVPGLVSGRDVCDIAKSLSGCKSYALQKFHPENTLEESFRDLKPYTDGDMLKMKKAVSKYVDVKLRLR
ncbi:MAG: anaerobic ribonucleoside-triphosphate reductase activating protein [archaeon]|nr:anaerobic ribonucleoside-triphosphate reductase activating protein [archaeon]